MMGFLKAIPLVMSIWIVGTAYAQNGPAKFTLKEAQDYAVNNNATSKNARLDLVSAKKKIWETTAIGLPQITSTVNYQNIIKVPTVTFPGSNGGEDQILKLGVKETTSLDITLSQLIFSGSYLIGLQASKTYYELSTRSLQKSEVDLKESVANAYYLVLVLDENIKIVQSNLENLNKTLSEMQEMNKQGFTEDSDIDQLKLSVNSLENTVRALQRQKEVSLNLLKFQMGFDLNQPIELKETLNDYITQASAATPDSESNIKANINYQLMDTQEKLSILNYKRQKSEYLPTLSGFYRHLEKKKSAFDFTTPNVFGFTMSIPVFSSGQKQSLVRQRKNDIEKIQNSKQ
ncbi:MAG: TolC family protein, partial [Bacteroidota bacterium]|nr:TolC family protein [Bacteroidota bacterium]